MPFKGLPRRAPVFLSTHLTHKLCLSYAQLPPQLFLAADRWLQPPSCVCVSERERQLFHYSFLDTLLCSSVMSCPCTYLPSLFILLFFLFLFIFMFMLVLTKTFSHSPATQTATLCETSAVVHSNRAWSSLSSSHRHQALQMSAEGQCTQMWMFLSGCQAGAPPGRDVEEKSRGGRVLWALLVIKYNRFLHLNALERRRNLLQSAEQGGKWWGHETTL